LNLPACAAWADANPECNACLVEASSPTGESWGPVIVYPTTSVLNQGGCIALTPVAFTLCAEAIEDVQECEHAACDTTCDSYEQSMRATCSAVESPCFVTSNDEASFIAIASRFCQ
jgi:hypothetical protein